MFFKEEIIYAILITSLMLVGCADNLNSGKSEMAIDELWIEYEKLIGNINHGLADLNPGATDNEIHCFEKKIGVELPQEFIDFYKVHNGQKGVLFIFGQYRLYSLNEIIESSTEMQAMFLEKNIKLIEKNGFLRKANKKWLFFGTTGGEGELFLNVGYDNEGKIGQVGYYVHEDGPRFYNLSFKSFFASIINDITSKRLIYDENAGVFMRKSDLRYYKFLKYIERLFIN